MKKNNFIRDTRGISAIEAAILLPMMILLVMAIIEFGIYFVKYQIATRAVSTISNTIQRNASDATHALATQQGLSFLDLSSAPNFICAKSYATNDAANAGLCNMGEWQTTEPDGVSEGTPYFVAVRAFAKHISITPFTALSNNFPPDINVPAVIQVNPPEEVQHGIQVLTSGTQWIVPDGFTKVKATIIGGGGGANGGWNSGGGGSGATIIVYLKNLTPRNIIYYSIGAGAVSDDTSVAKDGGDTVFNGLRAGGGKGSNNGSVNGPAGIAVPGQIPTSGTISTVAYFDGTPGSSYNGGGAASGYSTFGYGGGAGMDGKQGAIILEW